MSAGAATSLATLSADVLAMLDAANDAGILTEIGAAAASHTHTLADVTDAATKADVTALNTLPKVSLVAGRAFAAGDAGKRVQVNSASTEVMTMNTDVLGTDEFVQVLRLNATVNITSSIADTFDTPINAAGDPVVHDPEPLGASARCGSGRRTSTSSAAISPRARAALRSRRTSGTPAVRLGRSSSRCPTRPSPTCRRKSTSTGR